MIGILNTGYNEQRNIIGAQRHGIAHIQVRDRCLILHKLWHRISGKGYSGVLHSFAWAAKNDCQLVHSFNALVFGGMPWVVTYETTLPRVGTLPAPVVRMAWKKIAKPQCRAVIALSECAAQRLRDDLEANRPKLPEPVLAAIRDKLSVLHPPQPLLIGGIGDKLSGMDWDGPLRLALVGHDFYRKGGLEVLLAMDALIAEGKDLVLSIAGKMAAGDYASRAGEVEIRMAEAIIAKHPDRITRLGSIPAEDVHRLLRASHVLCLPTWGDTYGYSVLEGQAAGCAAISSDECGNSRGFGTLDCAFGCR